jgi:tRNA 2-thiouridine synthesizing protein A
MEEQPEQLSDALVHYFLRRACYFEAWNWANRQAGLPEDKMIQAQSSGAGTFADARRFVPADSWDAGEQGCGELALELRMRLEKLKPGQIFQLTARDLGVPQDMPAWCLLTGHILLRAEHPVYWIERKA